MAVQELVASSLCASDPWLDQDTEIVKKWQTDTTRLFVPVEDTRLAILNPGQNYQVIRSELELDEALGERQCALRMIVIPQEFSWGSLMISEPCARIMLRHLNAFLPLINVLHTFGQRTTPSNESLGSFHARQDQVSNANEICYLLKCVEMHGKDGVEDPWSIRQYAMYEQQTSDGESTFVLVNPSASGLIRENLRRLQRTTPDVPSRTMTHLMMASAAAKNWSAYVSWLEEMLYPMVTKSFIDRPEPVRQDVEASDLHIDVKDMIRLQTIQDKLHQARHVIETNASIFRSISSTVWPSSQPESHPCYEREKLNGMIAELETDLRRISTSLQRASATSNLIQNLLSVRSLQTLHENSNVTTQMASLARDDNKIMLQLSSEGRRDGRTLKTITVMTLVYLPASFVSTLLSMGYVSVQSSGGRSSLHFKPEMVIFVVLSAVLLLITFGAWLALDIRRSRRTAAAATEHLPSCDLEKAQPSGVARRTSTLDSSKLLKGKWR